MSALLDRRARFGEWLTAQQLPFGFDAEVADYALREHGLIANDVPPLELWANILPTLRIVELVREQFGPTTILSAYRAPAYNEAVGGEDQSQHLQNRAIDFSCANGSPADWATFLRGLRDAGRFKGGIGTYPTRGFVHVDTRGVNATWVR